jgi:NAD(P)H-flavin reductase/hemoglobin-like flavoprotein
MPLRPHLVKESFSLIEPVADKATAYFYGRLFAAHPQLRSMFPPAMDVQRDRLFGALTRIVWSLDSPESLAGYLGQLGRDHRKYGVLAEHYTAVGNALIATVKRFAAEMWDAEVEAAWVAAYTLAANHMIEAADAEPGGMPAWWPAEVIGHERRTCDIAVLTLRPDGSFAYRPGQYVNVQSARWPRVWRTYSIANAPRPDNTVRLHVRALPGGWVSTALVAHTRVGDTVTLGPPMGTMGPPGGDRDILAVAGGTGLAPLKAIVEHVLGSGGTRKVVLLHGVRTEAELYDLADLTELAARHPRLTVVPVVSGQPGYAGTRGPLPDVVPAMGSWADHEVFVCGPPDMVSLTVRRLRQAGVPAVQIHRDIAHGEPLNPALARFEP